LITLLKRDELEVADKSEETFPHHIKE